MRAWHSGQEERMFKSESTRHGRWVASIILKTRVDGLADLAMIIKVLNDE